MHLPLNSDYFTHIDLSFKFFYLGTQDDLKDEQQAEYRILGERIVVFAGL